MSSDPTEGCSIDIAGKATQGIRKTVGLSNNNMAVMGVDIIAAYLCRLVGHINWLCPKVGGHFCDLVLYTSEELDEFTMPEA